MSPNHNSSVKRDRANSPQNDGQLSSVAIVNAYIPPRPPPTREELRDSKSNDNLVEGNDIVVEAWFGRVPAIKVLGIWLGSVVLFALLMYYDVEIGGAGAGSLMMAALLGWVFLLRIAYLNWKKK